MSVSTLAISFNKTWNTMDAGALAAIGLAANILQFVDWISLVLNIGTQIRRQGQSDIALSIDHSAQELEYQISRIRPLPVTGCLNRADDALQKIALECSKEAKDLLAFITHFQPKTYADGNKRFFEQWQKSRSIAAAVKLAWKKDQIDNLAERLAMHRRRLSEEVIVHLFDLMRHSSSLIQEISLNGQTMSKQQAEMMNLLGSINKAFKDQTLLPSLPKSLTEVDPALNSAALYSHKVIENKILSDLYFRRMDSRERAITQAYRNTCSWIFEDPQKHQLPWNNFKQWMEVENGLFWIEGKAGSGKSTLMKFLVSDPRTVESLQKWAGSEELIVASYYLWLAGSDLQKNQQGLLRSLLHSVLSQRRDLISVVFPKHYNAEMTRLFASDKYSHIFFSPDTPGYSSSLEQPKQVDNHKKLIHLSCKEELTSNPGLKNEHDDLWIENMDIGELKAALRLLAIQKTKGVKVCLVIDGLDEFTGNVVELIELCKDIAFPLSTIKAVVSSRPEPEIVEAFQNFPKLRTESFTAHDIEFYVRENVLSHSRFQNKGPDGFKPANRVVSTVVKQASGLFLWVYVVVESVRKSLSAGDSLEEIEETIKSYPKEMDKLYTTMFERMEPFYRLQAFKYFRLIIRSQQIENQLPTAIRLSFMDTNSPVDAIEPLPKMISLEDLRDRVLSIQSRLRSRCCGLLEIHHGHSYASRKDINSRQSVTFTNNQSNFSQEGQIHYLHRSVSEFLQQESLRESIYSTTKTANFEPDEILLASIIYWFKARGFFIIKKEDEWHMCMNDIVHFLNYLRECEHLIGTKQSVYLQAFDRVLSQFWKMRGSELRSTSRGYTLGDYRLHWGESFLAKKLLKLTKYQEIDALLTMAIHYGLSTYVENHTDLDLRTGMDKSLVARAMFWALEYGSRQPHYMRIFQHLAKTQNLAHSRMSKLSSPFWLRSPWEILICLRPLDCPKYSMPSIFLCEPRPDSIEMWIQLVEIFMKTHAPLDVGMRSLDEKSEPRTAREVILVVINAYPDCDISSAGRDTVSRVMQALKDCPVPPEPSIIPRTPRRNDESSSHETQSEEKQNSRVKEAKGSIAPKPNRVVSLTPLLPVHSHSPVCSRCNTLDELISMGFRPDDAMQAMEKASVKNSVAASVGWLLANSPVVENNPFSSTKKVFLPCQSSHRPQNSSNSMQLWTTVTTKKKDLSPQKVPGALYNETPPKKQQSRRRPSSTSSSAQSSNGTESSNPSACSSSEGSNEGVINVSHFGTFKWALEHKAQSRAALALSKEQIDLLSEIINSMLAK